MHEGPNGAQNIAWSLYDFVWITGAWFAVCSQDPPIYLHVASDPFKHHTKATPRPLPKMAIPSISKHELSIISPTERALKCVRKDNNHNPQHYNQHTLAMWHHMSACKTYPQDPRRQHTTPIVSRVGPYVDACPCRKATALCFFAC